MAATSQGLLALAGASAYQEDSKEEQALIKHLLCAAGLTRLICKLDVGGLPLVRGREALRGSGYLTNS